MLSKARGFLGRIMLGGGGNFPSSSCMWQYLSRENEGLVYPVRVKGKQDCFILTTELAAHVNQIVKQMEIVVFFFMLWTLNIQNMEYYFAICTSP